MKQKQLLKNVNNALNQGLLKVMSKMGIATIASYRCSALFDSLGLAKEITDDCFPDVHCTCTRNWLRRY